MKKPKDHRSGLMETEVSVAENMSPIYQRGIDPKDLQSVRFIGQGVSGYIYKTKWLGKTYARKDFPDAEENIFQAEVDALRGLTHPNLVECFGMSLGCSCCSLVLEYVNDDLHNIVQQQKFTGVTPPFETAMVMDIISQTATAIMYLHQQEVAHGDLKSNNVLISHSMDGRMIVKVVDFGFTETKKRSSLVSKSTLYRDLLTWKSPEFIENQPGSLTKDDLDDPFLDNDTDSDSDDFPDESSDSKEAQQDYFKKCDVYSFGMLCYETVTGDLPFSNTSSLNKVKEMVLNSDMREILHLPEDCPSRLKILIEKCWNKEPSHRPSFAEICDELDKVKNSALTDIIEMAPSAIGVLPRENEDREEFPENKGASGMPLLQSMEQLCEKLKDVKPSHEYGVRVMGLYGMGGIGKTTISRLVCNQMSRYFDGKSCHVELGTMNLVELRKKVLQELTDINPTILSDSLDQLSYLLKNRMHQQKVFLVLDNVWDNQLEEALMYLKAGYLADSIVLVTSRSFDILQELHIQECDCLEMPGLEEVEAFELFLYHSGMSGEVCLSENDLGIIRRCIGQCYLLKPEKPGSSYGLGRTNLYHPLALKALGSELGRISHDVSIWERSLERLEADKFNMMEHHVFSVLRLGYEALRVEEQLIFMDLALFLVPKAGTHSGENFLQSDVWAWLCIVYRKTPDDVKEIVNTLWRKGLLEKGSEVDESGKFTIHDLYLEFAELEARAGSFEGRRWLFDKDGTDVPHELLMNPSGSCWPSLERLIIHNSKMRSLKNVYLHCCLNLEVLQLCHCEEVEEVDVTGMKSLRYMEVIGCNKLGQRIEGVENLCNLILFRWITDDTQRVHVRKPIHEQISLTALRVLHLEGFDWSNLGFFPPNLLGCRNLQQLTLSDLWDNSHISRTLVLPDAGNLPKSLLKLDFSKCTELLGCSPIRSMTSLTNLEDLNLNCCRMINDLTGLNKLLSLQRLSIGQTEISELPDLGKLEHLQFLDVSSCQKLTRLDCIVDATTLRRVNASRCENLWKLPDHFSSLENLEMVDLSWDASICTLPNDYERLTRCDILKVEGCWGLVVPLVGVLQREVPERSHTICMNSIGCVSKFEQSMQSWIDARMDLGPAAYDLLKHVFPEKSCHWSYLLDDEERDGFLIRALCEHYDRGGTQRLSSAVSEVTDVDYEVIQWWAMVATAPCTFGVVTERAMLEPYYKTLLHYTIVRILPEFLVHGNLAIRKHERGAWPGIWAKLGIEAVLRKCRELQDGKPEHGIYPVYNEEGRATVDTFLIEIEKLTSDHPLDPSWVDSSRVAADSAAVARFIHPNIKSEGRLDVLGIKGLQQSSILRLKYDNGPRYSDTLPNFPFGPILATQYFSWCQSSTKDVSWL